MEVGFDSLACTSPDADLSWRAHPARERVAATAMLVAFLGAVIAVIWIALGDPLVEALAIVILAGALAPWFLPTRYRIDKDSVEEARAGISRRRAWTDVRSVYVDGRGVTLSPFARRSWLEPYRAMRILFAGNGDRVVAILERRMSERCARGEARWVTARAARPSAPPKTSALVEIGTTTSARRSS